MLFLISQGIFFMVCMLKSIGFCDSVVTIEENSYQNVIVAIDSNVPENPQIIAKIQEMWTSASQDLYVALQHRLHFGEIIILVPTTWENSSYPTSVRASHYFADVLVVNFGSQYTNRPWTTNYGYCGQPGDRIYMTPDYILDPKFVKIFGSKGKTIVHEWAHYRWGIFDEFANEGVDPFYRHKDTWEATRCPRSLKGVLRASVDFDAGEAQVCSFEREKELRRPCQFLPFADRSEESTVSLMSHHYLDEVKYFCNDTNHNKEAPNDQNRICNLRSTWDVIKMSSDFAHLNQPKTGINTKPKFVVVKQRNPRIIFVLDASASMGVNNRFGALRQVLYLCITHYISNGIEVGFLAFAGNASILSQKTLISDETRSALLKNIPDENILSGSGTCIACGITLALKMLEKDNDKADGSTIIVLTDGEENRFPKVQEIAGNVLKKNVILHTIFLDTDGNPVLKDLVNATGGKWYFSGTKFKNSVFENFFTLVTRKEGCEDTVLMKSFSSEIKPDKKKSIDVFVDEFTGSKTVFSISFYPFSLALQLIKVSIMTPFPHCDCTIHSNSCIQCVEKRFPGLMMITYEIPDEAEVGRWVVEISVIEKLSFVLLVTAKDRPGQECISFKPKIDRTNVGTSQPIVISAEFCQKQVPILNAQVVAKIERPDGSISTKRLFDGGAAPDVTKNDGIYSGYFFDYNYKGRYSVTILGSSYGIKKGTPTQRVCGSNSNINTGSASSNGSVDLNTAAADYFNVTRISTSSPFERVVRLYGFEYNGKEKSYTEKDILPPSPIIDLRVRQADSKQITLTFSAPGDDLDEGIAVSYEIRYIINNVTQLRDDYESCPILSLPQVIKPANAGYGFALRARDETNNTASPSNVAVITFQKIKKTSFSLNTSRAEHYIAATTFSYELWIVGNGIVGMLLFALIFLILTSRTRNKETKKQLMKSDPDQGYYDASDYETVIDKKIEEKGEEYYDIDALLAGNAERKSFASNDELVRRRFDQSGTSHQIEETNKPSPNILDQKSVRSDKPFSQAKLSKSVQNNKYLFEAKNEPETEKRADADSFLVTEYQQNLPQNNEYGNVYY